MPDGYRPVQAGVVTMAGYLLGPLVAVAFVVWTMAARGPLRPQVPAALRRACWLAIAGALGLRAVEVATNIGTVRIGVAYDIAPLASGVALPIASGLAFLVAGLVAAMIRRPSATADQWAVPVPPASLWDRRGADPVDQA